MTGIIAGGGRISGPGAADKRAPVQEMPGTDLTYRSPNRGTGLLPND
jgi:hypothetical protein